MIVLAFVACLNTSPDQCREVNLVFAEEITPMACVMQAQPILAEWATTHPKWRVGRWKCGRPDQFAEKA